MLSFLYILSTLAIIAFTYPSLNLKFLILLLLIYSRISYKASKLLLSKAVFVPLLAYSQVPPIPSKSYLLGQQLSKLVKIGFLLLFNKILAGLILL